jgi:hypothetical protein
MRRPIGERGPVSGAETMELTARNLAREDRPKMASDMVAHIAAELAGGQAIEGRRQRERDREWER